MNTPSLLSIRCRETLRGQVPVCKQFTYFLSERKSHGEIKTSTASAIDVWLIYYRPPVCLQVSEVIDSLGGISRSNPTHEERCICRNLFTWSNMGVTGRPFLRHGVGVGYNSGNASIREDYSRALNSLQGVYMHISENIRFIGPYLSARLDARCTASVDRDFIAHKRVDTCGKCA